MAKQDAIKATGLITEALGKSIFRVELDNIDKTCKTEDQIFNMIRQIFDSNLERFLKEG